MTELIAIMKHRWYGANLVNDHVRQYRGRWVGAYMGTCLLWVGRTPFFRPKPLEDREVRMVCDDVLRVLSLQERRPI